MKCFLCRLAHFWDSPRSRAAAKGHVARCSCCAARSARTEAVTLRLRAGAGRLPDLHEAMIATTLRTAHADGMRKKSGMTRGTWLPLVTGLATAGVVAVVIYPQASVPVGVPAAANPEAGLVQVSAGANQIASALATVPYSLRLDELSQFAAGIPGWQKAGRGGGQAGVAGQGDGRAEEEPTQLDQVRDAVDPLGLTDKTKWKPIRELFGS